MEHDDGGTPMDFEALLALLSTAQRCAAQIAGDPLVVRLLRAFEKIPKPDRETILGVIERDATWCRIVEQTAASTGVTVRPNPHSSLYVHVFDRVDPPSEPLRRDIDVIRFGIERFVYLLPMFFQDGVRAQWTASARELACEADQELRAAVSRLAREVLAIVAEADAAPAVPPAPVLPPPMPPVAEAGERP